MKKGIIGLVLVTAAIRLVTLAGTGELLAGLQEKLSENGGLISATLSFEMGGAEAAQPEEAENQQPELSAQPQVMLVAVTPEPDDVPTPDEGDDHEVITTNMSADIAIKNDTGFYIDAAALSAEGVDLRLSPGQPQVLIIHTHSSEAYTMDGEDIYVESDVSRTEDRNYNVVRIGDELAAKLEEYGINVIHDRGIYDYPSYTGSYSRSGEAVQAYLSRYPSIRIVIDLHRDALVSGDVVYKTNAEIPGMDCAQVMLLAGTGENGLSHPNWRENLKLALYLQSAMDAKYPTLARPIAVKPERYNLHLTTGSLILEVGSSGNTLQEALNAIRLFADSAGPALAQLIEDE